MKTWFKMIIIFWSAAPGLCVMAQTESCANPNAPRIGIIAREEDLSRAPNASPELGAFLRGSVAADSKFRDQLKKLLPHDTCVVTNGDIFRDPSSYPQLKGSTIIEISAASSPRNPNLFALAVTVSTVQGVYVKENFTMFTIPVLIESESDYAYGAKTLMRFWESWGTAAAIDQKKTS